MALRNIRLDGDEILRKKAKEVDKIDERIILLLEDMADTMYQNNGIGLAAPQVGILKRIAVIDIGENLIELINPVIIKQRGEQIFVEGCLSIPDIFGEVKRPEEIEVEFLNREGKKESLIAGGLMAVAICHEIDHLDGILFKDKIIRLVDLDEEKRRKE